MKEKSLYGAASVGNVSVLLNLHQNDPLLVQRVTYTCTNNTPLHVATLNGHLLFVEKMLELNPHFSEELNSQQSSPLHIASAKGHLEIAEKLFAAAPHMCLSRDRQGRNPLHLAAIQDHVPVLKFLARGSPLAAQQRADRGLTVLHLCVEHGRLDALKTLMEVVQLKVKVDVKNNDGETILDMAKSGQQVQTIRYLKGAEPFQRLIYNDYKLQRWVATKRDTLTVVAVLTATIAFQVMVSPPGGVWQADSNDHTAKPYRAGESIMAYNYPKAFKIFMRSNSISFFSSLCTILLLISGLAYRRRIYTWILMMIFFLSTTTTSSTFGILRFLFYPKKDQDRSVISMVDAICTAGYVWIGVMGFLVIVDMVYLFLVKNKLGGRRAASLGQGTTSV